MLYLPFILILSSVIYTADPTAKATPVKGKETAKEKAPVKEKAKEKPAEKEAPKKVAKLLPTPKSTLLESGNSLMKNIALDAKEPIEDFLTFSEHEPIKSNKVNESSIPTPKPTKKIHIPKSEAETLRGNSTHTPPMSSLLNSGNSTRKLIESLESDIGKLKEALLINNKEGIEMNVVEYKEK